MAGARVGLAGAQGIPSGQNVAVAFDKEYFADPGLRNPAYPARLIATAAGFYHLNAEVVWQHAPGGTRRMIGFLKNGVDYLHANNANPPASLGQAYDHLRASTSAQLNAGDYVELVAFQDSGGVMNIASLTDDPTLFSLFSEQLMPYARVGKTAGFAISPWIESFIPFDRVDVATASVRNTSYPTRLIAPSAGIYKVIGHVGIGPPGNETFRYIGIYRNGLYVCTHMAPPPAFNDSEGRTLEVTTMLKLNAGNYLELGLIHDGAMPLQVLGGLKDTPIFTLNKASYLESGIEKTAGAVVRRTTALSIPHNTWQILPFNTAEYNPSGCWSSANPNRLTVPAAGSWAIVGHAHLPWQTGGNRRMIGVLLNGARHISLNSDPPAPIAANALYHGLFASTVMQLKQGDLLQLVVYQDSGAALDLVVAGSYGPRFSLARIA